NNQVRDPNETGIRGVTVTLIGTDAFGSVVQQSTTTGVNGAYVFNMLAPGTYTLVETQPAGLFAGKDLLGTAGGVLGRGVMSAIVLAPGQSAAAYTFAQTPVDPRAVTQADPRLISKQSFLASTPRALVAGASVLGSNPGFG